MPRRDAVLALFTDFHDELDDHNDRRERLIKRSRDVTILSKKVIFLLHRIMTDDTDTDPDADTARVHRAVAAARPRLADIEQLFAAMRPELVGERFWRYQRAVSPGVQEYIEALSFAHYLEFRTLIPFADVQRALSDAHGEPYFPLTLEDYVLGLSDLTGELMRYAISAIARRGGRSKANEVCVFVRGCRADFEGMTPYLKELRRKQAVTSQSLEKIENVAYTIAVRSSEYDLPAEVLEDIVAQTVRRTAGEGRKTRRDEYEEEGEEAG